MKSADEVMMAGNALGTTMLDIGNVVGNPAKPMSIRLCVIPLLKP